MKGFKLWKISVVIGFWLLGLNPGYGEVIDLGTLGGPERNGVAFAINDRGEAAGYTDRSDGIDHAFLYSSGVMTDLGTFGGGWSMARGINNLGLVVGYADTAEGLQQAFPYSVGPDDQFRDSGTGGVPTSSTGSTTSGRQEG